jgi:hypothetical protein
MALQDHSSCSWRLVAYPDRTAFFGDYFRIDGDTAGIPGSVSQMVDSRLGDLA